jgi:GPH family glycoside/pentoside/hexuronide:cation symporter
MSENTTQIREEEYKSLSLGERVGYGLGDFANNLVFGTVGGFLAFYMTTVNLIGTGVAALIFLVVRIINVAWDPMVGTFVDKRTSPSGKYRPWLLRAGIPLMILALLLFAPFPGVSGSVPYALVTYFAIDLVYSVVNIPYGSLNASLTRDPLSVDKITTTRMMLANTANLLVYTLFPMFVQMAAPLHRTLTDTGLFGLKLTMGNYASPSARNAWFGVYLVYAILGAVAYFICYKSTKERVVASEEQTKQVKISDFFLEFKGNKPLAILGIFFALAFTFMFFMNTVNSYFMQYTVNHSPWMGAIGLIGSIPGILLPVFWPKFKGILGKRGFFIFFLGMFVVGEILTWVWSMPGFHNSLFLGYASYFIKQWGLTSATGFMWALVPEVVSYGEWKHGKRNAGIVNALMSTFFKLGFTLGGAIPLALLGVFNFNETAATQSSQALSGINITFIWIPLVFAIVSMIVMALYPLSDKDVDKMNAELDVIRAQAQSAEAQE